MFHGCCSRPAAEEWNLATFWHPQDVMNAEFQRTWMSVAFPGVQLVERLESEMSRKEAGTVTKRLPAPKTTKDDSNDVVIRHFPDLYGYRGPRDSHKDVYFLNPWEFLSLWEVKVLPANAAAKEALKAEAQKESPDVLLYPEGCDGCAELRFTCSADTGQWCQRQSLAQCQISSAFRRTGIACISCTCNHGS